MGVGNPNRVVSPPLCLLLDLSLTHFRIINARDCGCIYRLITEVLKNSTGGGTMWRSVTVGKNCLIDLLIFEQS